MKNKFIKSTVILIIGGILTKLFSFIIRIYFTRVIGEDGISIYSIIMPTYSLLITITQLGFPIAISNIIAKGKKTGKNVIFSIVPFSIILNLFLILFVVFSSKYLTANLLHEPRAFVPLICLSFVLPFISIASILRGYFFGKQQMLPHTMSNVLEQFFKFFIVIAVLPHLMKFDIVFAVSGYILISIISETISIIIFLLYLPKKFKIEKKDIKPDTQTIKEVLTIGLPSVGGRIIGNIGFFFEPIILTFVMMSVGYSAKFIVSEYAVYTTYVIGLLIVPSFFITALGTALIPEISKISNNKKKVKKIYKKSLIASFAFGILVNMFIFIFTKEILYIIFKTTKGVNYIKLLAPFFIFYYLEAPMASTLQSLGFAKESMKSTTFGIIIKLIATFLLSYLKIGIYSLIIAEILFIFVVVILDYFKIKSILK